MATPEQLSPDLRNRTTLLFTGDSITNAFRMPGERSDAYRLGAGYVTMIAGRVGLSHGGLRFRFENRGVSGDGVDELAERWDADCLSIRPDLLSILVGINEVLRWNPASGDAPPDPRRFAERLDALLRRTRDALQNVLLVLCEPFALRGECICADRMAALRPIARAVADLAVAHRCTFVPLQDAFESAARLTRAQDWLYDGVHPQAAGHALIAERWLSATALLNRVEETR